MGFSIEMLNQIRTNASAEYQNRIPEATRENFSTIGYALQNYELLFNEYATALFGKIGKTIICQKLFKNPLAKYKTGSILTQQDVEEIFVGMGNSAEQYDPDGKTVKARRKFDNTKAVYHRMNRRDMYAISIGDLDFVRVFQSEATHDAFVTAKLNAVYTRANYDEWVIMKNTIATYDGYFDYGVPALDGTNNETACKTFVKTLRKAVNDLSIGMPSAYNKAKVECNTEKANMVLLVHKDLIAEIDVEVLAKAFNMGKTDIEVSIEVMDDFGTLTDTYGILMDKEWFRVYDTLNRMTSDRNEEGLFTNYFLHIHQIHSASPFKNAVRFTTKAVTV